MWARLSGGNLAKRCYLPVAAMSSSLNTDSTEIDRTPIDILFQPWHERVFVVRVAADQDPVVQYVFHGIALTFSPADAFVQRVLVSLPPDSARGSERRSLYLESRLAELKSA